MRSICIPNPAVNDGIMLQNPSARIRLVALLQRFAQRRVMFAMDDDSIPL